ncbi:hypothetical protein NK6_1206 [Bradyrhizobium diazoefficiens]|uniref:Uncharacterized protein n=1 Tax=Bradyrhizobium diazoefficiens TaxID=1355477 RepID=A0A0E4FRH2_9BRAD|nr:hypothetical protein NK6_1206 [Bradyrhizobium diazoefficiens]
MDALTVNENIELCALVWPFTVAVAVIECVVSARPLR